MLSLPKISLKTGLLVVSGAILLSASGYFGWQYYRTQDLLKNPTAAAIDEANQLVKIVGRLVILPSGEMPTIAVVSDKTKLAAQPFFNRAEEGDKVLIYEKEGRAILYRPKLKRVVEMTTVVQPTTMPDVQLVEATLTIWNGTSVSGLATVAENRVKKLKSIRVISKGNAVNNYGKSVVIVLNPKARNLAQNLAALVKAEVVDRLPEGETKPVGDLVLILGEVYNIENVR